MEGVRRAEWVSDLCPGAMAAEVSLGSVEVTGGGMTLNGLSHEIFSLFFLYLYGASRVECEPLLTIFLGDF
jgi:hypothetical protein